MDMEKQYALQAAKGDADKLAKLLGDKLSSIQNNGGGYTAISIRVKENCTSNSRGGCSMKKKGTGSTISDAMYDLYIQLNP